MIAKEASPSYTQFELDSLAAVSWTKSNVLLLSSHQIHLFTRCETVLDTFTEIKSQRLLEFSTTLSVPTAQLLVRATFKWLKGNRDEIMKQEPDADGATPKTAH